MNNENLLGFFQGIPMFGSGFDDQCSLFVMRGKACFLISERIKMQLALVDGSGPGPIAGAMSETLHVARGENGDLIPLMPDDYNNQAGKSYNVKIGGAA